MVRRWASRVRERVRSLPIQELTAFAHITVGFALLTWGLEAALPWTVWRLCLGAYALYWVGLRYLATIGLEGMYILTGKELTSSERRNR